MKTPRTPTIMEIIRQRVENDPITIQDRRVMLEKFGVDCRPKRSLKRIAAEGLKP